MAPRPHGGDRAGKGRRHCRADGDYWDGHRVAGRTLCAKALNVAEREQKAVGVWLGGLCSDYVIGW